MSSQPQPCRKATVLYQAARRSFPAWRQGFFDPACPSREGRADIGLHPELAHMAVLVSAVAFKRVPGAIRRDEKIAVLKLRRNRLKVFDLLHLADHLRHCAPSSATGLLHRLPLLAANPITESAALFITSYCAQLQSV